MNNLILASLAVALGAAPGLASDFGQGGEIAGLWSLDGTDQGEAFDRRGRGRGGDRDRGGRDRDGGHGGRLRVPGGSGCDDAHDIAEHPECRG